jgi:adenine-specific DNA-methyltransferase
MKTPATRNTDARRRHNKTVNNDGTTLSDDGLELIEFLSLDCTAAEGEWHSDSEIKIDKLGYVIQNGEKSKIFWDGKIRCQQKPLRIKIRNICGDESVCAVEL